MRPRNRGGVTLIEVVIALAIAGLAILGGVRLLDQLNDDNARIGRDGAAQNTTGNGERLLRRLLADARSSSDSLQRFHGEERSVTYMSLCDVPGGWSESCRVTLLVDSLPDSTAILASTDLGEQFTLRRTAGHYVFRYLDLGVRDSTWVRQWAPSIALPGALALVNGEADTVVFPLGPAQ